MISKKLKSPWVLPRTKACGFSSSILTLEKRNAQVWVETVLYLLVGLAVIAAILAFVRPKIAEIQDKIILDQSVDLLKQLDGKINDVWNNGEGNKKLAEIVIRKGDLTIDPKSESIKFVMEDSKVVYSQLNTVAPIGSINVLTKKTSSGQSVELWLNYTGVFNLTYAGADTEKILTKAPTPYKVSITNIKLGNENYIDIDLVS